MADSTNRPTTCPEYEAALEDLLELREAPGATSPQAAMSPELAAHLEGCSRCREALESARLSQILLREALEPAREPGGAFLTRVMASIRSEQARNLRADFWRPLEALASRTALAAGMALLALGIYLAGFAPSNRGRIAPQAEAVEAVEILPEPASEPANKDEVLLTLAGNRYGR